MNRLAVELSRRAIEKVKKGWTHETYARDGDGFPCEPDDENAVEWCLYGSYLAAMRELKNTDSSAETAFYQIRDMVTNEVKENYIRLELEKAGVVWDLVKGEINAIDAANWQDYEVTDVGPILSVMESVHYKLEAGQ